MKEGGGLKVKEFGGLGVMQRIKAKQDLEVKEGGRVSRGMGEGYA